MVRRWHYYLLSTPLALLLCWSISVPVNALQLTDGTTRRATDSSYLKMTDGSTRQMFNATYGLADTDFQNLPANYYVDNIRLNLSNYIPANNIFTFTVHYRVKGSSTYTAGIEYFGWSSGSAWTLLNDSCVDPGASMVQNTSTWETTLTCTYTGFTNAQLTYLDNVDRTRLVRFLNPDSSQGWVNSNAQITVGYIDSRTVSWNGLTQDDRDWLESVLPAGSSTADIEQAIESARDDEQSDYESQAEQNEADIDDASADAEATGQSLLSVLTGFLGVLTSAQPTNCNLDTSLIPHLSIPPVNLCQNSPPPAIVVLGSLILIGFVIPLAYHLVKRLLALIGEFQR